MKIISMELAAYCSDKEAASVTVVGSSSVPLERVLGHRVGAMVQALHESRGLTVRAGVSVAKFLGTDDGRLTHVLLTDNSQLQADVCVLGVGVLPNSECVHSVVDLDSRGYIVVDENLRTSCTGIWAAGDVASFPLPLLSAVRDSPEPDSAEATRVSVGHWQTAQYLGRVAAENAAIAANSGHYGEKKDGAVQLRTVDTVPFFWTQMFGKSLRFAGCVGVFDDILYSGNVERQQFTAFYCFQALVTGVATMAADPAAAKWAEYMASHGLPTKQMIEDQIADADTASPLVTTTAH